MNCDEAAEYVSALCDGAIVPRAAAEHINACESCRAQLREYMELGGELRRVASLEISETPAPQFRPGGRGVTAILWQKARKTMRIPRLALASLLASVVVLGTGWALQSVRAGTKGSVLLVQFTTGPGPSSFCTLSAVDRRLASCAGETQVNSGWLQWGVEVLSKDGDRAMLGVRARVAAPQASVSTSQVGDLPQQQYALTPGETLNVEVDGFGTMSFTGQWLDHIPAIPIGQVGENHDLDPGPDELRFFSPLLLHGGQAVGDLEGASTSMDQPGTAVDIYLRGTGRFDLALSPMRGAVEGKVRFNRINFAINGQSYVFVTGAPISRGRKVWVLHSPNPPDWDSTGNSYLGTIEISKLLSAPARN
jgi:hypothetical protein